MVPSVRKRETLIHSEDSGGTSPPILETRNLVTRFYTYEGIVQALDGVSLSIDPGTTFGLVGESGCGKSVFARSLMRIIGPPGRIEGGRVLLRGDGNGDGAGQGRAVDLLALSEAGMERIRGDRISMIFQEPGAALNPIMSVGDQVAESFLLHRKREMYASALAGLTARCGWGRALAPLYRLAEKRPETVPLRLMNRIPLLRRWRGPLRREARCRSAEILGRLGISDPEGMLDRFPHQLSGGMKQRIVIAMALACGPALLIADEATSNLDVTVQAQILDLLKQLKETEIGAVLLITHDLGVVAETCDRAGVMYAGYLCETAGVRDLFTRPRHPYTDALLRAVPRRSRTDPLARIPGTVPNLVDPPPGCRFHPRCPRTGDVCRKEKPVMVEMGPRHWSACHFPLGG